jgi:hypothetical protein
MGASRAPVTQKPLRARYAEQRADARVVVDHEDMGAWLGLAAVLRPRARTPARPAPRPPCAPLRAPLRAVAPWSSSPRAPSTAVARAAPGSIICSSTVRNPATASGPALENAAASAAAAPPTARPRAPAPLGQVRLRWRRSTAPDPALHQPVVDELAQHAVQALLGHAEDLDQRVDRQARAGG